MESEPAVIASHIVYFFLPLPDVLDVPDKYVLEVLEQTPIKRAIDEKFPLTAIGASLCFHRVDVSSTYIDELTTLLDVATTLVPRPADADSSPGGNAVLGQNQQFGPQTRALTIAEIAVGVDLDGGSDSDEDEHLTQAFEKGLEYVREFQRAYYLTRREPIRLVARESLPFAVPFGIRELYGPDGEPLPFEVPLSVFLVNMNLPKSETSGWTDADSGRLESALFHQSNEGPFASYMDLVRESEVALLRDGSYGTAVLFTATACEVLFDELLAHMMWEEAVRPEDASTVFDSLLTARVKSEYHLRLGGKWNLDVDGPIKDWAVKVARPRNRVVHGGHYPSLDEAREAINTTAALATYLGDLVASRASEYSRTALVFPGEYGLKRRGKWTDTFEKLRADPNEVHWQQTFARWRLAMRRARKNSPLFETPSAARSYVYMVIRAHGSQQCVVHDAQAGMAALMGDIGAITGITGEQKSHLKKLIAALEENPEPTDLSVYMDGAKVTDVPLEDWRAEYRLVPTAGVMVNGKDLDPPRG